MKKKSTLAAVILAALLSASPATVSAQNYDFSNVKWKTILDAFTTAVENGMTCPTEQEIVSAAGVSDIDLAFIKSHVKQRDIIGENARLLKDTYGGRKLWMNTPMGIGSGGDAGYPTGSWHNDVFSLWNYTALWGSWNHGVAQIPGSWTDAAHKNGCAMLGGTIFADSYGTAANINEWINIATAKDEKGFNGFKYVKPLVNMLYYFGMDGININWEFNEWRAEECVQFHQALYKYADQIGFKNFHLGIYTAPTSTLTNKDYAETWYADSNGQISDFMLNYNGESYASTSVAVAKTVNPEVGAKGLYQGFWIVGMNGQQWAALGADESAKQMNICLWGEHKANRFWSYNSGAGTMNQQANYQGILERAFSGGNRNPLDRPAVSSYGNNMEWQGNTPPLQTWAGFSTWIPERSTVTGTFPFYTNFNLGNGERYNYRGKKTAGAWYNMSAQDVVPSYRWLVLKAGQKVNASARTSNAIDVQFTHEDSYNGGSCIRLKGDASQATDIVLYKTNITPNEGGAYALVAIKGAGKREAAAVSSNLCLILEVNGSWKEYQIPDNKSNEWEEHRLALDLAASDKVTHVGLRVKGGDNNYNMYVGELQLNDGKKIQPKTISDLVAFKTGETKTTMDVKLGWKVDMVSNEFGVAYNSDADIDHFEILFKDNATGTVKEIGRTSQWAAFVPAIDIANATEPYVGVAAVSKDLKTVSEPVWEAVQKDPNIKESPFGTYGQSSLDVNAEGYSAAINLRGVERFRTEGATEDIDYSLTYAEYKAENNNGMAEYLNYHHVTDKVLKVKQGEKINFFLKGFNGEEINGGASKDDCRYCFVGGWMDFDGSGTFNYGLGVEEQMLWKPLYADRTDQENFQFDETTKDGTDPMGERVFRAGSLRKGNPVLVKNDGLKGTISIPSDAHVGKSRLRIVYSDAWFAGQFSPTANTNKGYTLDIDVEIIGDENGQRMPNDFHDQGTPDDWTVVTDITVVDNVAGEASVKVVDGTLVFENTLTAEIYADNGMLVKRVNRPRSVASRLLTKGVYLIRLNGNKTVKVAL